MSTELPACAAIRSSGGILIAGKRHGDCLASMVACGLPKAGSIQGFMTTHGRFVDRRIACLLMLQANVASAAEGGFRGSKLFSEDLY